MAANLLHTLKVLTQLVVQAVGKKLRIGTIDNVLTTIEEPLGNTVLKRVLHNSDDALQGFGIDLTSALGDVNVGLAANEGSKATTNTLNSSKSVDDLLGTFNVGI